MPNQIKYDFSAANSFFKDSDWTNVKKPLEAARDEVFTDVELAVNPQSIPQEKQPLDAGFINWCSKLLQERDHKGEKSEVAQIEATAKMLQSEVDRIVVLGIGGSYMGLRALFESLCSPYHNELSREERNNIPRLYFAGNNVDNDETSSLLELLKTQCKDPTDINQRWGIIVISKSGGTLETAVSFRLFRQALESYYGSESEQSKKYIVPVTGDVGKLRSLADARNYPATFSIPNGIGGRFSIFTSVGLLPAAVLGIDIVSLLEGASEITQLCKEKPLGENSVLDYTAVCHLLEKNHGMTTRILSTWGQKLEATGLWYDQLLAESLGKEEQGAFPLTVVNTRDLHSRGQQHQEGIRDKLITNLHILKSTKPSIQVPKVEPKNDCDLLNRFSNKTLPDILEAAFQGTNQAYADANRPTTSLFLPEMNAHLMGQLFQFFMLATVIEGRLIGINPYGQPGVEAYKQNMNAILSQETAE